jgi:energy-coupling factor transporter ATP-binding protein EcfA2
VLYDSPTAGLDPITANTIVNLILKERDSRNTAAIMVTHRYQDGHLMANFRYNPVSGQIEPASGNGAGGTRVNTRFLGAQAVLVGRAYAYGLAAGGPAGVRKAIEILRTYIRKFVKSPSS